MAAASKYSPIRCFSSASLSFADLQEYKKPIAKNKNRYEIIFKFILCQIRDTNIQLSTVTTTNA